MESTKPAPDAPARLLLAEDDPATVVLLRRYLDHTVYELLPPVRTASEAVEQARRDKPDAILMDIGLEGPVDGIEAVRRMRDFTDAPILYLTHASDDATVARAKATAPFAYLVKPFGKEELIVALDMAIERHRRDGRLSIRERQIAATLDGLPDAVLAVRPDGIIRLGNRLAHELLSPALSLSGHRLQEVLTTAGAEHTLWTRLQGGEAIESCPFTHPDGTQMLLEVRLTRPASSTDSILVLRDVTQLRSLESHLRQSQKIEAVGRLAAGIAHDFNNLLSVINSYAELLSVKLPRHDPLLAYVRNVRSAGGKAADLVSKLMAFSRREPAEPQQTDVVRALQDLRPMLSRVIRENIEITIESKVASAYTVLDPSLFDQAILNLAVNARDAMPEGGRIEVTLEATHVTEDGSPLSQALAPGDYLLLSVGDTGCGMDEDTLRHVFEPFFTTKPIGKGTGLGLATVYGFVQQAGGHVEVTSQPGQGTTFHLYLPSKAVTNAVAAPAVEESLADAPKASASACVFVVEDDATFGECVSGVLRVHGYEVIQASDGHEALEKWRARGQQVDLLLTDVVMPKMSGTEVARHLREAHPELPVIYMTGYDETVLRGENSPDGLLLQKPFSLTKVLTSVRALLDESAPVEAAEANAPEKIPGAV